MNRREDDRLSATDEALLDQLADGELGEVERRELLGRLDSLPGGWRACAMAFLQTQSWRQELGAIRREADRPPQPALSAPRRHTHFLKPLGTLLAMAASFLIALGVGAYFRGWRPGVAEPGQIAETSIAEPSPSLPGPLPGTMAVPESARPQFASEGSRPRPWQTVTVPVSGPDGRASSVRLPAVECDNVDPQWLGQLPSPVPPEFLEALEQSGHRVVRQRQLLPVPMQDGRQLVVPVDEVEIHPVGNHGYQ